jgi:hypothetical protein
VFVISKATLRGAILVLSMSECLIKMLTIASDTKWGLSPRDDCLPRPDIYYRSSLISIIMIDAGRRRGLSVDSDTLRGAGILRNR